MPDAADSALGLQPMTKADRSGMAQLARKRAKVAKNMVCERVKVLRADVEDQLSASYSFHDELWATVTAQAAMAVATADEQVAATCRRVGIPEHLRPHLVINWHGRGENALASRRVELRKLAESRIGAAAESAKVAIEANLLVVETELIRDGLESARAVAYLDAMPTAEQLLPPVDVTALAAGHVDDDDARTRWRSWEPPQGAAAQLLTPSSATSREEKRLAILAALTADSAVSDRQIARAVGVDHKTVGKWRGEIPTPDGEIPTPSGEIQDVVGGSR